MDIRIKTAEEFHDAHVTIEIKATDQREALDVVGRLMEAPVDDAASSLTATDDQKEIIALRQQVKAYDIDRQQERKRADENRDWAERAEARIVKDAENHATQLQVRDNMLEVTIGERDSAGARIVELVNQVQDRDKHIKIAEATIQKLTRDVGRIAGQVYGPQVAESLRYSGVEPSYVLSLKHAINTVRGIVGGPGSVPLPSETTPAQG